jgi:predicted MFS family arabinose efflux permease
VSAPHQRSESTERSPLRTVLTTPHALVLLGASLVGRLPTAMAALAIVQLVRLGGGDFALAGAMTAVYIVAGAAGQPLLSRIVDRRGRTGLLVVSAVVSSIAFVAVATLAVALPLVAGIAAAAAGFFAPPLEPSLRALWPRLVGSGAPLKAAFSLDAGAQEVLFILGPLLTVAGIAAFGATGNVVFAAALGLVGALAFAVNPMSRRTHVDERTDVAHVSPWASGGFRRVAAFAFAAGLPVGVLTIAATTVGEARGIDGFSGWALALNALGALIGATVLALRPLRVDARSAIGLCGLLLVVGYIPLAFELPTPLWLLAAVLAGVMFPPTLAQVFEVVGSVATPGALNEANAWTVSAINVGIAAGTLGAGAISSSGVQPVLLLTVGGALVVTAASALLVRPRELV